MDANWRPTQGTGSTMDTSDWRTQLQPGERLRIANKILDKFKRHRPVSDQDGLLELCKFALRFEEECYTAATSKSNYVRRLTLDVPTMENNTQNTMMDAMQSNAGIPMQSQVHNPGQSLAIPVPNQFQSRQQLLYQNIQNSIAPPVSNIGQTPIQNVVGPNSNVQNNMFGGSQRQMPPRQQVVPQQQQQLQNSQPYLYQQKQLQQKYLKHEILPGNIQHSLMQPNIQMQQLQQPNLQPNQLQSLQSSVMQTSSVMQPLITQTSDMQQRFQGSSSLLQRKNALDQQNQPYRSQKTLSDSSSNSLDSTAHTGKSDGDDWQEEVFQNHEPLPHQVKSEQLEELKILKTMLERLIAFLQVSKGHIAPCFKEKMAVYEKEIINFINTNRPKGAISSMQSGQLPPPHMQLPSQPLSLENQMNSQMQSTNLQSSIATMPKSIMASLQHISIPSISGLSTTQQNMINSMLPGANLDSSSVNSLQQVGASTLQQNSVNAPQQTNTNHLSLQGEGSVLQQNSNPLQPGSTVLKHQLLKQPQEEQMLQNQQLKHLQQRQLLQRQQMLQEQQQQLQQATKQQVPAHMHTHQMPTLHQINNVKMRQGLGVKPGTFQQYLPSGQRSAYPQQQFKCGGSYPVSSPHLLQAASPQIPQHSSPQVDQQNLPSLAKASTPLQSANSPFVAPTPSPPLAPSPLPGDSEKPISVVLSVSNAVNVGHQQTGIATVPAQSLAIGTPGISLSPLLAEFSGPDGGHSNALTAPSAKLTVAELPIERLTKAVKSLSSKDLSAAVSGIASVVSMVDRIAVSAPGNGSRAAVGEDLVAMTKSRLQARNFIDQDGTNGTKRMRRHLSATPLNVVSSPDCMNGSMKQLNALEAADLDSATTASIKKPRIK